MSSWSFVKVILRRAVSKISKNKSSVIFHQFTLHLKVFRPAKKAGISEGKKPKERHYTWHVQRDDAAYPCCSVAGVSATEMRSVTTTGPIVIGNGRDCLENT